MKMQCKFSYFALLSLFACMFMGRATVLAQAPAAGDAERLPLVLIDLHLVEMKEADAEKLFNGSMAHAFYLDGKLLKDIRSMIEEGGARTVKRMRVAARSGQSAEIKGVIKSSYPNEFEEMGWTTPVAAAGTNAPALAWVQGGQAVKPADFEDQESGCILSVTPDVSPDKEWVTLTLIPVISQCVSFRDIVSSGPGGNVKVQKPEFFVISTASSVSFRSGAAILFGAVTPPGDDGGKIVLSLLTATVVP